MEFDRNTFCSFFYLQVTLIVPTKFESTDLPVQEKKRTIYNFQEGSHAGHLEFPIRIS